MDATYFTSAPPDESAGVRKVVPSPPLDAVAAAAALPNLDERDEEKKSKKDRKKKRKAESDADVGDLPPILMLSEQEKRAEVIKFAAKLGVKVFFEPVVAAASTTPATAVAMAATPSMPAPSAFRPHVPSRPQSMDSVEFETYMAGAGTSVNMEVKAMHNREVTAVTTDGKSLGDKKYGCAFCGSLHHLECHQKGNDPPCIRTGAFSRFIQNYLFEYDIAPEQEWRRMYMFQVPGHRRVMAERFAMLVGGGNGSVNAQWTDLMHRRSWDARGVVSSNLGTSRELFVQGRVNEFLYFQSSGASTPRPGTPRATAPTPVPFDPLVSLSRPAAASSGPHLPYIDARPPTGVLLPPPECMYSHSPMPRNYSGSSAGSSAGSGAGASAGAGSSAGSSASSSASSSAGSSAGSGSGAGADGFLHDVLGTSLCSGPYYYL
jgi:hypothetical protein